MVALSLDTLHPLMYEDTVRRALLEDLGRGGDLTTDSVVDAGREVEACVVARQAGRVAGAAVAAAVFTRLDAGVTIDVEAGDGIDVEAGAAVIRISGSARAILTGERTALNFFGRMCGVATLTRSFVAAVGGTRARIVGTRKTTPGLRVLEKYAVRCGGGVNHRFGLDDAVLVKDNHVAIAGGVRPALERVRGTVGHVVKVEVEVDTLEQLEEVLEAGADAVLLDNMDVATLGRAVDMVAGRLVTEASGGIDLDTVADVAATGVDLISVGALTHSAPCLDLSLEMA